MLDYVSDTRANRVTYAYIYEVLPHCRISQISNNGTGINFWWEARPDPISFAVGGAPAMASLFVLPSAFGTMSVSGMIRLS